MKTLYMLSMMMNSMFTTTKQPMIMVMIILTQTIIIAIKTGMESESFWFSYMLVIIFIGGMMVMFIYITSITPNEMNSTNLMLTLTSMLLFSAIALITMMKTNHMSNLETNTMSIEMISNEYSTILKPLFNEPMNKISLMMMIYLFIAMIAVTKITDLKSGPLRKKN
uniref:NADH-ubiquinone oxidoreductase chain 6 n=1 Tax=Saussurella borneensis TaxID=510017 RepID=A0A8F2FA06_9ORTH|nr:NADH dehydrogenase subunit 6 [Saussurella borneensis]